MKRCYSVWVFLIAVVNIAAVPPVWADDEASNVPHVAAGTYGRCYAKSVPAHIHDPDGAPRQQGRTTVFRVSAPDDVVEHRFDWFSQRIFLKCSPARDTVVVRTGPWHRGHNPRADHLAIAFYKGGKLLRRYSTLDIAGNEKSGGAGLSRYRGASASVSHYTVFATGPEMVKVVTNVGPVFKETWVIEAKTVDGRALTFDMVTGDMATGDLR